MTATSTRARKTKGFQFQKQLAEIIRTVFGLEERDVVSTPSSVSGVDILLSKKAKEVFPFSVESKRQESTKIWEWIKQAEQNRGDGIPLVVFKKNHSDIYCCLSLNDLLGLLPKIKDNKVNK